MITIAVEEYTGERDALRWSFELAEDSESELLSYLYRGRVLVARVDGQVAGHLLLVDVDGDTAHVVSDFLFFGRGPGAPAEGTADLHYLGRYHDDFVRTEAGWQFGRREIEFW